MTPGEFRSYEPLAMSARGAIRGVRAIDGALNRSALNRVGTGPFNIGVDALLQWNNDRGKAMGGGTRAGRIGVAVGAGVAAGAATALICAGTAGFGCPLAVGVMAGFMGNVAADAANKQMLPTDQDRAERARAEALARQARELRKHHQWYNENARPAKEWFDRRVEGGKVTRVVTPSGTATSYYAPYAEHATKTRIEWPDGRVEWRYYDDRGHQVTPR
jgi:hypothetical protein